VSTWHVYSLASGQLTGAWLSIDDDDADTLSANTPPDHGLVAGVADWESQCVDLATGELVDWQPPAPADDALRTWAWHADAKRWLATPTQAAVAADVRRERAARLAASDWVVARATELHEPVPQAWRDYRKALRDLPDQPWFPATVAWPAEPSDP